MYLYDNLGRQYDRKNIYLHEVSALQQQIKETTGSEKEQLKQQLSELVKNKDNHDYNKKLADYHAKEKALLEELKNKIVTFKQSVDTTLPKSVQQLEVRLYKAKQAVGFYQKYVELTYDAELLYKQYAMEMQQIPAVIEFAQEAKKELDAATKKVANVDTSKLAKFEEEFKQFKLDEKKRLEERIAEVKAKQKEGVISKQARENGIKELKRVYKESVLVKSFECEKTYNQEIIKNKKHELHKVVKQKINTVNINVADLRRVHPIEVAQTTPWKSYVSCLIPGLGQLLNKQYVKAIIMFLATIYTYFMAIPYALGYGNYKGEGLAGLVNLAANAGRLDRSIIFMIEGIVAIFLIVIAAILLYLCFRDANKVEKDKIKGIRIKSWTETRQTFLEDGFPYIVLSPALIITVFIVLVPIATTILLSFTNMGPDTQAKFGWAALENYKLLVLGQGVAGAAFWKILGWTVVWTICATTLAVALGFILAIVLNNDRIKGKALFRSIYLLPWAVPAFITITFFSVLASPDGTITVALQNVFGSDFSIKNDPFVARMALICMQAWLGSAYVFILSTGVLQSINAELYEAADIDGATSWKKLAKITVPLVLFQTAPLLVGQYTFNFNNFSIIYLFNGGGPFNPTEYGNLAGSTDLLISYIYKLTMENQYQALGAAITIVISIGLIVLAYIGFRNTEAFKKE